MTNQKLNQVEQKILIKIAREALEKSVRAEPLPKVNLSALPAALQDDGASFVTLTIAERLRGCIGTLQPYQPLAEDVQEHAVAAALEDPRFPKVKPQELAQISLEISVLSPRVPFCYVEPQELIEKIRPGVDGVVLQDGFRKATFLPQVWEKLPNAELFLSQLCSKMGAPADLWRTKPLNVYVYQVQEFHEE
jgi:uncharacterized protein